MHSLTFKKHLHSECSTASVGGCEVNKAIVVKVLRFCREREREGFGGGEHHSENEENSNNNNSK